MDYKQEIDDAERRFQENLKKIAASSDTFLRRSLLILAERENDLIFTYHQKMNNGGRS